MFAEHFFASIFFFPPFAIGLRKASIMCAVFFFPRSLLVGDKNCFFWGWGGKKEEEMKTVSVFAARPWRRVYLNLFLCSCNVGGNR